jgi:cysteine synthase A
MYLKKVCPDLKCFVIDHQNSGLFNFIKTGKITERKKVLGNSYNFVDYTPGSTVIEGIATERISGNLRAAIPTIDGAFIGTDHEAIEMAYYLKEYEGLIVGSSAALNLVGAVKTALKMGEGHTIVTVICDTGKNYMSKLYNHSYL